MDVFVQNTPNYFPPVVATQGPLPGTIGDFWRLVWQEDTRVIVMLCNEKEVAQVVQLVLTLLQTRAQ